MDSDRTLQPAETFGSNDRQLSKRAARRLIQRACVLAGRDKHVRAHIREAHLATLWVLEDWEMSWTVVISRGRIEFDRRPTKRPDLTLTWRNASDFFARAETGAATSHTEAVEGDPALHKFIDPVSKAFFRALASVLRYPVDDTGESLL